RTGNILGTPGYMSPEQAQGTKTVDGRSDLWALGVIAYECVVGHVPFESEALGDLLLKICVQPIPIPSEHASVPPGFDAWFARACNRDVDKRFQSAKELAEALRTVLTPDARDGASGVISAEALGALAVASHGTPMPSGPTMEAASTGFASGHTPRGILDEPTLQSGGPAGTSAHGATVPGIAVPLPQRPKRSAAPLVAAVALFAVGAGGGAAWLVLGRGRNVPSAATSALVPPITTASARVAPAA